MLIHLLSFVLSLLTWSTQDAFGLDLNFTISEVRQCEPVSLTFSTDVKDSMNGSMTLTILPFGSAPIFIPISNVASNYSQVSVNFIPLRAGNQFIASLDDANGQSIANISDVTKILPSLTNNSSCIVARTLLAVNNFDLVTSPTQCEGITVTYDTSVVQTAPRVRAYVPRGDAMDLTKTADDGNGTVKYLVNIERGNRLLLLFQDDNDQRQQTTELLTVAGDTSTSERCLTQLTMINGTSTSDDTSRQPEGIPQGVILGGAIGGAIILLVAVAMVIFLVRDRKRKKRRTINSFFTQHFPPPEVIVPTSSKFDTVSNPNANPFEEASAIERGNPNPNFNEDFILNPPYVTVMGEFEDTSDTGNLKKVSMSGRSYSSWTHEESNYRNGPLYPSSLELTSIHSLDIEGMLNRGQDLGNPCCIPEPEIPMSHVSGQVQQTQVEVDVEALKAKASHSHGFGDFDSKAEVSRMRHWRTPSDVPVELPYSGSFSGMSIIMNVHPNPFSEEGNNMIHSPLIQSSDEPARPASDNVLPAALEHVGADAVTSVDKSGKAGGE